MGCTFWVNSSLYNANDALFWTIDLPSCLAGLSLRTKLFVSGVRISPCNHGSVVDGRLEIFHANNNIKLVGSCLESPTADFIAFPPPWAIFGRNYGNETGTDVPGPFGFQLHAIELHRSDIQHGLDMAMLEE